MSPPRRGLNNPAEQALRVLIADEHVLTAESLFLILSHAGKKCELVGRASSAAETVLLCTRHQPDLLLIDSGISAHSGVRLVPEIKRQTPRTRILLYCSVANEHEILAAMRAGADGFLEKSCSRSDFLIAVERTARGDSYLCSKSVNGLANALRRTSLERSPQRAELTTREREILKLIVEGQSNKEVAKKLYLSVSTVETHRANLMTKVGARNVAQLVHYALRHNLLSLPEHPVV
jgi:Response regulator containing a CheY-like receiver domain and an HTH DNA-binding domain